MLKSIANTFCYKWLWLRIASSQLITGFDQFDLYCLHFQRQLSLAKMLIPKLLTMVVPDLMQSSLLPWEEWINDAN